MGQVLLLLAMSQLAVGLLLLNQPLGKSTDSQEALGLLRQPPEGLEVRLHNVTLAGRKLWAYLDEMPEDKKPGLLCLTETHLMGVPLNKARRRAKGLGWHWFGTPATPTIGHAIEAGGEDEAEPRGTRTFANHGGEAILALPKFVVTGHHQDPEAQGFRSVLVRLKGCHIHLISIYFDVGFSLDEGPNAEKAIAICNLIRAIKLPFLVVGDFNVPPEVCAASMFFNWLGGIILVPMVDFTCVSSHGENRILDYGIISAELQPHIRVEPFLDHPFKPHTVGVSFFVNIQADLDFGYILKQPKELDVSLGPREVGDTWWCHWNKQQCSFPTIAAPWAQGADRAATILFARWSRAAESFLLSTFPEGQDDEEYMGRGSNVSFQLAPGVLTNRIDHIYATPSISFWERIGNSLRTAKAHAVNSSFSALDGILQILDKQVIEIDSFWLPGTTHSSEHFKHLVSKAAHLKDAVSWRNCNYMANALLQKALKIHGANSSKLYFEHCISLCAGGASGAHKLLKVFEKDEGLSYESEHAEMQKKLGPTIAARMSSRISTWAIGKWQVHRERQVQDLEEAFQLLQLECVKPEHQLQPVSIRHMRNVLAGGKRKTGMGCDLWPLHLWSFLPDEALRGLHLIIRSMLQGKVPLQALLTLVSFMGKAGWGRKTHRPHVYALQVRYAAS